MDFYPNFDSNLTLFALVNLNVALLGLLIFVVGRNIIRLIFEWRRNVLGTKLRVKLAFSIVGLVLVPTTVLFVFASGFLNNAFESWLGGAALETRNAALKIAQEHHTSLESNLRRALSEVIINQPITRSRLSRTARLRDISGFAVLNKRGVVLQLVKVKRESFNLTSDTVLLREMIGAFGLSDTTQLEELNECASLELEQVRFLGCLSPLNESAPSEESYLLAVHKLSPSMARSLNLIGSSYRDYQKLKLFKSPLKSGYLLTFSLGAVMVIFAALWVALYVARQIVIPLEQLARATQRVARGDYQVVLETSNDDELGYLIQLFNTMTHDLKVSKEESEKRRLFIEAIVKSLTVGVISIDTTNRITLINGVAAELLGINGDTALGARIGDILTDEVKNTFESLLSQVETHTITQIKSIHLTVKGEVLEVQLTLTPTFTIDGNLSGAVLLLDDITELKIAHQLAAWREVARRIAHEIKNPLTPIQLSAQRLIKRAESGVLNKETWEEGDLKRVSEIGGTIVEHVDSIKRLADEFSNFARMPILELTRTDLNHLVNEIVGTYSESVEDIFFQAILDPKLPPVTCDTEQIRRALRNLLDNAVDAIKVEQSARAMRSNNENFEGRITLSSRYDKKRRVSILEILDNGTGIKPEHRMRIFDPYFTKKKNGTGLGLPIVNSIIADHGGNIRVHDSKPRGTKFIIELP